MPVIPVCGEKSCEVCESELEINCMPSVKPGLGVCDECGLPYTFEPAEAVQTIDSVVPSFDESDIEWDVVEAYYKATGKQAVVVGCFEFTDSMAEEFNLWANEEFDMYWGMDVEEAKNAGY